MSDITVGMPVRHRTQPTMQGRVRRVVNGRALVTWVRQKYPSYARLKNLEPISDADLSAFCLQQEAIYDRLRDEHDHGDPMGCQACLAPPARTSDENRAFLLGTIATESPAVAIHERAGFGVPMEYRYE